MAQIVTVVVQALQGHTYVQQRNSKYEVVVENISHANINKTCVKSSQDRLYVKGSSVRGQTRNKEGKWLHDQVKSKGKSKGHGCYECGEQSHQRKLQDVQGEDEEGKVPKFKDNHGCLRKRRRTLAALSDQVTSRFWIVDSS